MGAKLERYQRYTPKLTNIAELKDCFVDDMPQEFIVFTDIKAIVSFRNRLRLCAAAVGGYSAY